MPLQQGWLPRADSDENLDLQRRDPAWNQFEANRTLGVDSTPEEQLDALFSTRSRQSAAPLASSTASVRAVL